MYVRWQLVGLNSLFALFCKFLDRAHQLIVVFSFRVSFFRFCSEVGRVALDLAPKKVFDNANEVQI